MNSIWVIEKYELQGTDFFVELHLQKSVKEKFLCCKKMWNKLFELDCIFWWEKIGGEFIFCRLDILWYLKLYGIDHMGANTPHLFFINLGFINISFKISKIYFPYASIDNGFYILSQTPQLVRIFFVQERCGNQKIS